MTPSEAILATLFFGFFIGGSLLLIVINSIVIHVSEKIKSNRN